ncbi:DUF3747 domain-containing protein [Synechococcus sp. CS-602]|uniref:DUF3747 domain-containing protein n=1 Tax=Synechococcaceae TaxID=1890426 RepID=UPI0008FF3D94|nr:MULTISPECIES: DUF3747 domain-containing protein [Synechococcaceae]MCT4363955.1 DUF3747 domain-containing protein [Candidatus Regnicoccus frigidus MAG-AL1]APD49496.1 hypothetical protein BM449_09500 [Synechococcus sp. SynAce01]MCT0201329.1 DUF3747 domain-containing protein [Synechococcus sp. CS-603]MCT0205879.1 DUF3747 domain-containing protein [Synechococcus sp. CS-602]MCT0245985.1 DUF3747 domain-containing protein [Synechococcus sp. CS-601]
MRLAHITLRLAGLALLASAFPMATPMASRAQALFAARDVEQERFVLVAAPIGDGSRSQLNIYEQINDRRPCFASSGDSPARVEPLLGSFDFSGICSRYLDANGYSLRIGETDLGTVYRISVVRSGDDNVLLASPTRNNPGPNMIVARTNGQAPGFLLFNPEPGWKLMRRHFGNRALGHLYLYRETWPGDENVQTETEVPPTTELAPGAAAGPDGSKALTTPPAVPPSTVPSPAVPSTLPVGAPVAPAAP